MLAGRTLARTLAALSELRCTSTARQTVPQGAPRGAPGPNPAGWGPADASPAAPPPGCVAGSAGGAPRIAVADGIAEGACVESSVSTGGQPEVPHGGARSASIIKDMLAGN
jgi:hypothetical protein